MFVPEPWWFLEMVSELMYFVSGVFAGAFDAYSGSQVTVDGNASFVHHSGVSNGGKHWPTNMSMPSATATYCHVATFCVQQQREYVMVLLICCA